MKLNYNGAVKIREGYIFSLPANREASLAPGTCSDGYGCFLPDLTRFATVQCGEARQFL